MVKAPTDDQLDAWLSASKIASIAELRNRILQIVADLEANKVSNATANEELRFARSALRLLSARIRG